MLSKITFISIFVIVCFISSVKNDDVYIYPENDNDFATQLFYSLDETVGVIFINHKEPLPAYLIRFSNIVKKIFIIDLKSGQSDFIHCNEYFNYHNVKRPTFYVVQTGFLLSEKLVGNEADTFVDYFITLANDPKANKRDGKLAIVKLIEQGVRVSRPVYLLLAVHIAQISESRNTAGSMAVHTERPSNAVQKRPFEFDLNELPPSEHNNSPKRQTGGSNLTTIFHDTLGDIYSYDTIGKRSSTSPRLGTGSSSAIQSKSSAATGSGGSKRTSKSPSAATGSGGSKRTSKSPYAAPSGGRQSRSSSRG